MSVIIPTYNRSSVVLRAIQSVKDQAFSSVEVVVVDDGSTDNTREAVTSTFGDSIQYIYQPNRGGPASARNTGLLGSHGQYIHFLDSDDYFLHANISRKVQELEENPLACWAFSDCYFLRPGESTPSLRNSNIAKLRKRLLGTSDLFELLLLHYFVNTDTVMMRRECVESVGGFDENLSSFEDMDFFYRLAQRYEARFVDDPLVVITHGNSDSLTADMNLFYKGKIEVIEKTKKLFPEETRKVGFPGRSVEADVLNYLGTTFLKSKRDKQALRMFLKSIRVLPFQKQVYSLFIISLFRTIRKSGLGNIKFRGSSL